MKFNKNTTLTSAIGISLSFLVFTSDLSFADVEGITSEKSSQVEMIQMPNPEDYATAKSEMPMVDSLPDSAFDNNVLQSGSMQVVSGEGHEPRIKYRGKATTLFNPILFPQDSQAQEQDSQAIPQAAGGSGLQFTSSKVFPQASDTAYPLSTTGKIWFTINGFWKVCSGSMVKPGIVVTAGHCVHSGNNASSGWYSNFQFAPAYRSGSAPYGIWRNWAFANTTGTWYSGGGSVPNDADYAVIVFNKNASGRRIGDYTGWLGWQYPSMIGHHITTLGYPNNLDGGSVNHRVDSNVNQGGGNTGVFGSDMTGGSSGGAIVLNLRQEYTGVASGWEHNPNRLVSVVSYGATDTSLMRQGGSQFDSRFQTLLNNTCSRYPWAC
ncbi:conserved exported hypothetical protein [Candidatus Methylobacter favarea]|uniref:Serine protease n=1 Tax=Candidatus Methylobacter favarea TaxID=2707345 RepID=A0A8S0WN01_9GAMM|nr:trypsin-like serine protease [Candidatus Methylobacter favarea]CAA9890092.1 conserved exported hypothetical protein [Candidatus Methylobacter favarea]